MEAACPIRLIPPLPLPPAFSPPPGARSAATNLARPRRNLRPGRLAFGVRRHRSRCGLDRRGGARGRRTRRRGDFAPAERRRRSPPGFAVVRLLAEPVGWTLPPVWDPIAGDYPAADGWIRLHTNAARHRAAALAALGSAGERDAVAAAVRGARADELEAAIVARGGCAAVMRSLAAWADHPQGRAVAAEPLVLRDKREAIARRTVRSIRPARSPACAFSTSPAFSPGRSRPASSPPTAPTCCASTRPTGTSRASRRR